MGYDCKRIKKILAIFGHDYTKKEMRRMKKKNTPLYRRVLEVVNIFLPKISHNTPIWRVFLLEKNEEGQTKVNPLANHHNIRITQDKSISIKMIHKLCLGEMKNADDRTKLYHLIQDGKLECLGNKKVYKHDKFMNSCILMDHGTEFAQFIRDQNGGIKRMTQKLGSVINYHGNFRKGRMDSKKKRVKYICQRIEVFSREITELIKNEGRSQGKIKKKHADDEVAIMIEEEEKEVVVVDPILSEISVQEAVLLLGAMMTQ